MDAVGTGTAGVGPGRGEWIRTTFLGWVLGFLLILAVIAVTGMIGLGEFQFGIGLGMGMGVGLIQARRLPGSREERRSWVIATTMGATAPFLIFDLAKLVDGDRPWSLPVAVVGAGLCAGLLQARWLRHRRRPAGWWVPASVLAWGLAALTVVFADNGLPRVPGIIGALLYVGVIMAGGVFLGLVQGIVPGVTQTGLGRVNS